VDIINTFSYDARLIRHVLWGREAGGRHDSSTGLSK